MSKFALTPIWDELVKEYEEREFFDDLGDSLGISAQPHRHRLVTGSLPPLTRDPVTGRFVRLEEDHREKE